MTGMLTAAAAPSATQCRRAAKTISTGDCGNPFRSACRLPVCGFRRRLGSHHQLQRLQQVRISLPGSDGRPSPGANSADSSAGAAPSPAVYALHRGVSPLRQPVVAVAILLGISAAVPTDRGEVELNRRATTPTHRPGLPRRFEAEARSADLNEFKPFLAPILAATPPMDAIASPRCRHLGRASADLPEVGSRRPPPQPPSSPASEAGRGISASLLTMTSPSSRYQNGSAAYPKG